jgi:hypothetical protein
MTLREPDFINKIPLETDKWIVSPDLASRFLSVITTTYSDDL